MTTAIHLTELQRALLANAAMRDTGSLLPPPPDSPDLARMRRAVAQLIRRGFVAEVDLPLGADLWRSEGDRPTGAVITNEGRAAMNVEGHAPPPAPPGKIAPVKTLSRPSKTAEVLTLLSRADGATLEELVFATNWLPHSTRAALTGLRKRGHAIDRGKRGDVSCYRLIAKAAA